MMYVVVYGSSFKSEKVRSSSSFMDALIFAGGNVCLCARNIEVNILSGYVCA
jgi:hypothetical protein